MPATDQDKSDWLTKLTGTALAKTQDDEKAKKKGSLLLEMQSNLGPNKELIRSELTFVMKEGRKTLVSQGDGVDFEDLIETEDVARYMWVDKTRAKGDPNAGVEAAAAANKGWDRVVSMHDKLKNAKTKKTGPDGVEVEVPLFTEQELADEFWEPLRREGLIPENLIPNRYSNVQKMHDKTNQIYQDWVKEQQEQGGKSGTVSIQGLISQASKIGQSIAKEFGDMGSLAADAIQLGELALNTTITIGQAIKKSDADGLADSILDSLGKMATTAVSMYDADLATVVGDGIAAGTAGIKFVEKLCKTDLEDADIADAIDILGDCFSSLGKLGGGIDPNEKELFEMVGANAKALFKVAAQAKKKDILQALKDRDLAKVGKFFLSVGKTTITQTFKDINVIKEMREDKGEDKGTDSTGESEKKESLLEQVKKTAAAIKEVKPGEDFETLKTDVKEVVKDVKGVVKEVKEPGKDMAEALKDIGTEVYDGVKGEKQKKDLSALALQVVTDLAVALGKELAKIQPALEGAARTSFRAAASADRLAAALQRDSYPRAAEILAIGLESSVKVCITHTDADQIGAALKVKFTASLDVTTLKNLLSSDKSPDEAAPLFGKAGESALGELQKFKSSPAFAIPPEKAAAVAREIAEAEERALLEEIRADEEAFQKELDELDQAADEQRRKITKGEGGDASVKSIVKLIQVMQTKRLILQSAAKVAQGGLDVAAKFFAPLEIAGASLKFIQCVIVAANQAMELNNWLRNAKKAKKGESIYGPTIDNFVNNRELQLTHATIKAALQLVKLAGGIVAAFGGMAAPAGEAIAKAAAIAEASEELIYQSVEKGRVIRAWSVTREAMLNPNNRKLGKRARNLNHTLAKFALAYGAVVQKERIAIAACSSCGINEETLAHKDTNVQNVQKYFEIYFPDDKKVIRDQSLIADWQPKTIRLTAVCLSGAQRRGEAEGQPKLGEASSAFNTILAGLTKSEKLHPAYLTIRTRIADKTATADDLTALREYEEELERLVASLATYLPIDKDGRPQPQMRILTKDMKDLAEERYSLVKGNREAVELLLTEGPSEKPTGENAIEEDEDEDEDETV